jgi:hypothetical protein
VDGLVPRFPHLKEGAEEASESVAGENGEGVPLMEGEMVGGEDVAEDAGPRIGLSVGFECLAENVLAEFTGGKFDDFTEEEEIFLGRIELELDGDRGNLDGTGVTLIDVEGKIEHAA